MVGLSDDLEANVRADLNALAVRIGEEEVGGDEGRCLSIRAGGAGNFEMREQAGRRVSLSATRACAGRDCHRDTPWWRADRWNRWGRRLVSKLLLGAAWCVTSAARSASLSSACWPGW